MSKDDYMNFLSEMDISIFNTYRQIGLGNISPLLYMEKKIFIPKGSVMYDFYRSEDINICDYNDIQEYDFETFIESVNMKNAKKHIISNELNLTKKIEIWSQVFNAPMK